jgi:ElaA protein
MGTENTDNVELEWHCKHFEALTLTQLERWFALRQQVFVIEQNCPYADIDGRDSQALHLLALAGDRVLAGARIFAPDAGGQSRIGRVVVDPVLRGQGMGYTLMREALDRCRQAWPEVPVIIGAQAHLQPFYGELGFIPVGELYDEDGIPHINMRLTFS